MKTGVIQFGTETVEIKLPNETDIFAIAAPQPLADPTAAIADVLAQSIGSPGLETIIAAKLHQKPDARAVVVISDNTRPVPYKGKNGILWPVIQKLLDGGFTADRIAILVATGTHRLLTNTELQGMLDPLVFEAAIPILQHNCLDQANLVYLGETRRGSQIYINRQYMEADFKILTGLVESHFMAGVSGGRKSVCPGLIGEESTFVFHSAKMLASPHACDLRLEQNPCHEEALEVARRAGVDYIVNVTLDHHFNLTGVFAGDLEQAHQKAVERLKEYVALPADHEYDIVVTHAGFVGINHYQAAKAGVAAAGLLKPGGTLIMAAHTTDADPVGSARYRSVLHLLKLIGVEKFNQLILSPDWTFIPEQWQVQMWTKLFAKIPMSNFIFYSPQLAKTDYQYLPGMDGNEFLPVEQRYQGILPTIPEFITAAIAERLAELHGQGRNAISIAFLTDGPYGIPVQG